MRACVRACVACVCVCVCVCDPASDRENAESSADTLVGEVTDTLDRTVSDRDRFSGHTRAAAGSHSATNARNVAERGSYFNGGRTTTR